MFSYDGELWLAFAGGGGLGGGKPNRKTNIGRVVVSDDAVDFELDTVLEHQWCSAGGPVFAPYVATSGPNEQLIMAWTGGYEIVFSEPLHAVAGDIYVHDCYERRFDQLDDTSYHQQGPPEGSDFSPSIASYVTGASSYLVLWRGTDEEHHLYQSGGAENNVGLGGRTGWTDCSAFAPSVIHHRYWIYAWAGTDPVNKLNVAVGGDLEDMHVPEPEWYSESHGV